MKVYKPGDGSGIKGVIIEGKEANECIKQIVVDEENKTADVTFYIWNPEGKAYVKKGHDLPATDTLDYDYVGIKDNTIILKRKTSGWIY